MTDQNTAKRPPLKDHQEELVEFIVDHPKCGIFLSIGGGKTLTTLSALERIKPDGHILVIAPVAIARSVWLNEIEKFGFNVRTKSLIYSEDDVKLTKKQRLDAFAAIHTDPPTMYFINNELLTRPPGSKPVMKHNQAAINAGEAANISDEARTVLAILYANAESGLTSEELFQNVAAHAELTRQELDTPFNRALIEARSLYQNSELAFWRAHPKSKPFVCSTGDAFDRGKLLRPKTTLKALQNPDHKQSSFWREPETTPVPTAKRVRELVAELREHDLVLDTLRECTRCKGQGCRICSFGLIDQLPRKNGKVHWPFKTVIVEESQSFKSPTAARFKALAKTVDQTERTILLTGTPTPLGLQDIWSQVYLLDQGEALGERYNGFRDEFFTSHRQLPTGTKIDYRLDPGAAEEIHRRINHLVVSSNNTAPIPRDPDRIVEVVLPKPVMDQYKEFKKELVLTLATPKPKQDPNDPHEEIVYWIDASNQAVLRSKLLQFASGTVYTGPDHENDFAVVHDEKLELMAHHVTTSTGGEPVLIAYRYQCDRKRIVERLAKESIDAVFFDGSRQLVSDWNDKKIRAMLIQPASTAHGINLQHGGSDLLWYTLPDSLEHWLQTNGRLQRLGQNEVVQVTSLVTKGTYDAKQPDSLKEKQLIQDGLLDAVRIDSYNTRLEVQDVLDATGISWQED